MRAEAVVDGALGQRPHTIWGVWGVYPSDAEVGNRVTRRCGLQSWVQSAPVMPQQPAILLVEDQRDDAAIVRRAFDRAHIANPLIHVASGEECLEYFKGHGIYRNREIFPVASLVLLDLEMPGMNGFEVLKWIRQQQGLKDVRVVVLTGHGDMKAVGTAYELGASSFMVKPLDFTAFLQVTQTFGGVWTWGLRATEAA